MPSKKELLDDIYHLTIALKNFEARVSKLETAFKGIKGLLELAKADQELPTPPAETKWIECPFCHDEFRV